MLLSFIVCYMLIGVNMGDGPPLSRFDLDKKVLEMLTSLAFQVTQTNDKLAVLEERLTQTNDKLAVLEETLKKEVDERKDMVNPLTKNVQSLREEIEPIKQKSREVDNRIDKVEQNITVPWVYFLVSTPKESMSDGRPILTKVMHNVGDSYDASSGTFTCRVAGLYQFAFNFLNAADTEGTTCKTNRNGYTVVQSYGKKEHDSATMVTFLYLSIGDTVTVTCDKGVDRDYGFYMWFTGTLVRV